MATDKVAATGGVNDVIALLNLVRGAPGQTSTTTSNISKAGADELLAQALRGNQGLAAIAGGAKGAGVYNSSTNKLLVNDFLTSTAAKVEALRTGQTTKTRGQGLLSDNKILMLLAANKLAGTERGKKFTKAAGSIWDQIFNGSDAATAGATFSSADGVISASNTGMSLTDLSALYGGSGPAEAVFALDTGVDDGVQAGVDAANSGSVASATESGSSSLAVSDGTKTAASTTSTDVIGGQGSNLGYAASALDAYNASQTNGDYRRAVGSAILNYFGWGAATPIVDAIARPISDRALRKGKDVNGLAGSFQNDPIGALLSGQESEGDTLSAALDPINIFGANPGGSLAGFLGNSVGGVGDAIFGTNVSSDVSREITNLGDSIANIFGW